MQILQLHLKPFVHHNKFTILPFTHIHLTLQLLAPNLPSSSPPHRHPKAHNEREIFPTATRSPKMTRTATKPPPCGFTLWYKPSGWSALGFWGKPFLRLVKIPGFCASGHAICKERPQSPRSPKNSLGPLFSRDPTWGFSWWGCCGGGKGS